MAQKLVADFDGVIIKPTERAHQMHGNLVVPDTGKEKPEIGIIVSIGPGAYSITGDWIPTTRKVGDEVVLPKFGTSQISIDGEDYYLTKEKEIYAHFEEELEETPNEEHHCTCLFCKSSDVEPDEDKDPNCTCQPGYTCDYCLPF